MEYNFYKVRKRDKVWMASAVPQQIGPRYFSFDKKTVFNFWTDYPDKLTKEQKELFDKENPDWVKMKSGK